MTVTQSGIVVVQGILRRTGTTITAGASGTIATLPVGARPPKQFYAPCVRDNGFASIIFDATGEIRAELAGTWTSGASYVSLHTSFRGAS